MNLQDAQALFISGGWTHQEYSRFTEGRCIRCGTESDELCREEHICTECSFVANTLGDI